METKDCFLVCMNDYVARVVLGDEDIAKQTMIQIKLEYYNKNKWSFDRPEDYSTRCYWHLHNCQVDIH